jgi:hypothetical protein
LSQDIDGNVRWRTTIGLSTGSRRPGFYFYKKLSGVLLRCPKCGQAASALYRQQLYRSLLFRYYVKCRSCHKFTFITEKSTLVGLLRQAMPGSDVQEFLL